uniref:Schlafen AlbA-2 domain-containing protein n=1 Tax=Loxodonta africana TaxID=9785 RepID=G3UHB3_LOXAF
HAVVQVATPEATMASLPWHLQAAPEVHLILKKLAAQGKELVVRAQSRREISGPPPGHSPKPHPGERPGCGHMPRVLKHTDDSPGRGLKRHRGRGSQEDLSIVRKEMLGQVQLFQGAFLGSERHNVEFKHSSSQDLSLAPKHHMQCCACAPNSGDSNLFMGIEDSGLVQGIRCSPHDQDLLVDSILQGFKPQAFPDTYTLTFNPVISGPLKVIHLHVHAPKAQSEPQLRETLEDWVLLLRGGLPEGSAWTSSASLMSPQKWMAELGKVEEKVKVLTLESEQLQQELKQLASLLYLLCLV